MNADITYEEFLAKAVNAFLGWPLPHSFSPDAGITFEPVYNKGTPYQSRHAPIGTNLLSAEEATAMFKACIPEQLFAEVTAKRDVLKARIAELESRLELWYVNDQGERTGKKVEIGEGDGIGCRDEAIKQLGALVRRYETRIAELEAANKNILRLLRELDAMVRGECPSLLNEDSGGDIRLALEIEDALKAATPTEPKA